MPISPQDIIREAAKAKVKALQLQQCFDPNLPESRPYAAQELFFKDTGKIKYRYVVAGNGCLAKGTLVATPEGPRPIESLKIGDTVYSEHGEPIKVLEVYSQGVKPVVEIKNRKQVWAEATLDHVWQIYTCRSNIKEKKVSEFSRDDTIIRKELTLPLGNKSVPEAYAIGALLGDGCSRQDTKNTLHISSGDPEVVYRTTESIGSSIYKKQKGGNYTWVMYLRDKPELYNQWCSGRKAHQKIVDIDEIKSWDRESLLQFVAGLIDTDGAIYTAQKHGSSSLCVRLGMQALSVIEAFQYCLMALWQTPSNITIDNRDKYINGPVYSINLSSNAFTKRIVKELSPYLQCERKRWKPEYSDLTHKRSTSDRVGQQIDYTSTRKVETYDIHVDSPTNLYCLANGLVTHNSGKSALAGRELSWIITDTHPHWKMPEEWKDRPLQILVIGKSRSILENELWIKKLKPFLGDWKEVRGGNVLQYVEDRIRGHRIIFLSHSDGSQKAIDNLQAYDADIVWLDEMPAKLAVLEETQRRVRRPYTMWFATFTPKSINVKIRKLVEAAKEPTQKRYRMSRLDVPGADKDAIMQELAGLTNAQKRTILYGDWAVGDEHVYDFQADDMSVDSLPAGYSKSWRHVECVDPGSNRGGITIWAEDPYTNIWYCVKAEYIDGLRDPVAFYDYCQDLTAPYNIVRRICDPAATPHIGHAAARKCSPPYMCPPNKNQGRKEELIKNFQKKLSGGQLKLVYGNCPDLIDELSQAQRNDSGKIINSHSYHLADCCHYFSDMIPKPEATPHQMGYYEQLRYEMDRQRAKEAKQYNLKNKKKSAEQVNKTLKRMQFRGPRWR